MAHRISRRSHLLLLLVPLQVLSLGCNRGSGSAGAQTAPPPTGVQVMTLEAKPIEQASEFIATLRSLRSTTIQPEVEGLITRIFVKSGDKVRTGDPLVQINADRQVAVVAALDAQLREGRVQLQFYRVEAPQNGTIGDIPVRTGDRVTTSTVITTIDQNDALEAYVQVPLDRSPELRVGLPVQIFDAQWHVDAPAWPSTRLWQTANRRGPSVPARQ